MTNEYLYRKIERKKTKTCTVGNLTVGGDNPIWVQSMTNTKTSDSKATLDQIERCFKAGVDIMRVSVPDKESTDAIKEIVKFSPVPIVADIHFHYKRAIEAAENGAHCLRINPGNIGSTERLKEVIKAAKANNCSIRIGVNVGSLEDGILKKYNNSPTPEALVESAMNSIKLIEDEDFTNLKVSVKASDVILMIKAYTLLSSQMDYPLHLGVTESGPAFSGTIKSSVALGNLLLNGIGDTIRVSLSADQVEEVKVGFGILKSLGIRSKGINIISCPSCARQQFDVISAVSQIENELSEVKENIDISILGCVVNGIGEATRSDIGITGALNGQHLIYLHGKPFTKLTSQNLVSGVISIVKDNLAKDK